MTSAPALLAIGYGSDTLSSAATVQAAQGFSFTSQGAPIEMNNAARQQMEAVLVAGGITGPPTYAEQTAYQDGAAIQTGFAAAAEAGATQQQFMTALRGVTDFDAAGTFAPAKINFSKYGVVSIGGCIWTVKLSGTKFIPYTGIPFCGTPVKG